jgi:hypothetical protein
VDDLIKQMSKRLAGETSRRGFAATIGKVVLGVASALAAGQSFLTQTAEAQQLQSCTGNPCPSNSCPPGTHVTYTWTCSSSGVTYYCNDCYNHGGHHEYTYAS